MKKSLVASNILDNISNRMSNRRVSSEKGRALIVFTGSSFQVDQAISRIFDLKESGYDVALGFSFMGQKLIDTKRIINCLNPLEVLGEEDIFRINTISSDYSLLVMPNITINTLSKVCSGMIDSFASNILWTFLYKKKEVLIDFNSVRNYLGEKPGCKEIEDMIEDKISKILKMGALELEEIKVDKEMEPAASSLSKDLITEKDIVKYKNKKLIVNNKTIISPLARDKARELNIEIVVE